MYFAEGMCVNGHVVELTSTLRRKAMCKILIIIFVNRNDDDKVQRNDLDHLFFFRFRFKIGVAAEIPISAIETRKFYQ